MMSKTFVTTYFLRARYWRQQGMLLNKNTTKKAFNVTSKVFKSYLSETLFAEGTLGSVVQAALQAVFTESVAAWCCHGFIKQSVSYSEMSLSARFIGIWN